ncbi:MAG: hypothetical protein KDN19_02185 [Verrucomicrobiae bacterium]|nr:hypothetical protein [Verrucomicrobiae bacterium]
MAEKMKPALLASTFWFGCSVGIGVWAEQEYPEPGWPGPEMVGDWDTFNEQFKKWEIAEFEYGGGVADGGSLIFEFKATDGSEFEVLVACSSWWTKEDWKKKQQPIFLLFETKAYRISKGSESEERLLLMLNEAASELEGVGRKRTIYIERLHEIVKSRALHGPHWPMGDLDLNGAPGSWNERTFTLHQNAWPFDRLDLEGASGDWSKLLEQFKKWRIEDFILWDTLGDVSTVFKFATSDRSEIGILVPTIRPYYPPKPNTDDPFDRSDPVFFPQAIYLHFNRQLYPIEEGSEAEEILLAMLDRAAKKLTGEGALHPGYIECLREIVKSRKIPPFDDWPFDRCNLDGQQGADDQLPARDQSKAL